MRQPLRYQIMLPMLGLILTALVGVSMLNAFLAAGRAKRQIEQQLWEITQTLERSNFPLTDSVLRQMRGLSGAEYVLATGDGKVIASSTDEADAGRLPLAPDAQFEFEQSQRVVRNGTNYFYAATRLARRNGIDSTHVLHIFYPEAGYRQMWTAAVFPPLAIGLAALALTALAAVAVAARVSRPLSLLKSQAVCIAQGNFTPTPLPQRNDEVRDLAESINHMAAKLDLYEQNVRETERLRTLAQLGGGIAHQMRNAATGCRMAIDILADEQALPDDSESLVVARRQLELMESHIKRFLAIGKPSREFKPHPVDLSDLIDETLPLVRSAARHVAVDLQWNRPEMTVMVLGDRTGLEQLVINLLLNGIEAASNGTSPGEHRFVDIRLDLKGADQLELIVQDSGPGPSEDVKATLFEPFVTGKSDGVGLGLSVARHVVQQHRGQITWNRDGGVTCFRVEMPQAKTEKHCVTNAGS